MTTETTASGYGKFQIAIAPSSQVGGATASKKYFSREALAHDLLTRLNYTKAEVIRFFEGVRHEAFVDFELSEDDWVYFGWLPEFDRQIAFSKPNENLRPHEV